MPRAVDADTAGLILVAGDGPVRDGTAGRRHESVDPSRRLFDVTASGDAHAADIDAAFEFGALATAAQLVGAGQAHAATDRSNTPSSAANSAGVIGSYQAIKHKLADVHIALELARPLVYGAALSLADRSPTTARDVSAAKAAAVARPRCWRRARRCRPTGPSASPRSTTCRCGCCGCRHCARHGAIRRGTGAGFWRRCDVRSEPNERELLTRTVARLVEQARRSPRRCGRRWSPSAATTRRCGRCCASRSAPPRWWFPRNLAARAANSPTPPSSSRSSGKGPGARPRCSAPRWPSWHCWQRTSRTPTPWNDCWPGPLIGTVVFDPDYVVNGDVADVVIAATDGQLEPVDRASLAHPCPPWTPPATGQADRKAGQPTSAPIRDWPTPRRSCWRPSRSAPPPNAST